MGSIAYVITGSRRASECRGQGTGMENRTEMEIELYISALLCFFCLLSVRISQNVLPLCPLKSFRLMERIQLQHTDMEALRMKRKQKNKTVVFDDLAASCPTLLYHTAARFVFCLAISCFILESNSS